MSKLSTVKEFRADFQALNAAQTRKERKAIHKAIAARPSSQARRAAVANNRHVRSLRNGMAWSALFTFALVCWAAWQGVL